MAAYQKEVSTLTIERDRLKRNKKKFSHIQAEIDALMEEGE